MKLKKALALISDGHAVYRQETSDEICDALGIERVTGYPMHSTRSATNPKGLLMKEEGEVVVDAKRIGQSACAHYGLEVRSYFGRGSQAQAYARALGKHLNGSGQE